MKANILTFDTIPGTDIYDAAKALIAIYNDIGAISLYRVYVNNMPLIIKTNFNGVDIECNNKTTYDDILTFYYNNVNKNNKVSDSLKDKEALKQIFDLLQPLKKEIRNGYQLTAEKIRQQIENILKDRLDK